MDKSYGHNSKASSQATYVPCHAWNVLVVDKFWRSGIRHPQSGCGSDINCISKANAVSCAALDENGVVSC
ncbi:MAG: hypothetical protein ACRC9M_03895, partial [Aeromonas sp.]